jgi:hypothetical protein
VKVLIQGIPQETGLAESGSAQQESSGAQPIECLKNRFLTQRVRFTSSRDHTTYSTFGKVGESVEFALARLENLTKHLFLERTKKHGSH